MNIISHSKANILLLYYKCNFLRNYLFVNLIKKGIYEDHFETKNEGITYRYWHLSLLSMPNEEKDLQHLRT